MDSYANAAITIFESGHRDALKKWLRQTGESKQMTLYLLSSKGEIIGNEEPPAEIRQIGADLVNEELDIGILKFGDLIISHEILSTSGTAYRLAAVSEKPLAHFVIIPWAGLTIRLSIAIIISGLICYLLSVYLTQPLRSLKLAVKSIAKGQLNTRVGRFKGHNRDELANLSLEFDRMAEQLEALVNSKERLLQDISHELRSPLARLQIAIELGHNKTGNKADAEFQRMEIECLRLNTLIGEILEFARLDKSVVQVDKKQVAILPLLQKLVEDANFEFNHSKPGILPDTSPVNYLFIDERLIHRAIENVLRNAYRYSPPDEAVRIKLSIDDAKQHFIIDVLDRGPGVPEDQLETIFNPFYRVDTSREKKTGGYGLGLAIADKAIKKHRGTIVAMNRGNGGLHVRITLPIHDSPPPCIEK